VGAGVGASVGTGVGTAVGTGVGMAVGSGVGAAAHAKVAELPVKEPDKPVGHSYTVVLPGDSCVAFGSTALTGSMVAARRTRARAPDRTKRLRMEWDTSWCAMAPLRADWGLTSCQPLLTVLYMNNTTPVLGIRYTNGTSEAKTFATTDEARAEAQRLGFTGGADVERIHNDMPNVKQAWVTLTTDVERFAKSL
jgi:hypothetical protein